MQRFALELTAPLLADSERSADLGMALRSVVVEAVAEHEHRPMTVREHLQHRPQLSTSVVLVDMTPRVDRFRIRHELAELRPVLSDPLVK